MSLTADSRGEYSHKSSTFNSHPTDHMSPNTVYTVAQPFHQDNLCATALKMYKSSSQLWLSQSPGDKVLTSSRSSQMYGPSNGVIVYFCKVKWLSWGKMVKRFYYFQNEIRAFMKSKEKFVPEQSLLHTYINCYMQPKKIHLHLMHPGKQKCWTPVLQGMSLHVCTNFTSKLLLWCISFNLLYIMFKT